MLNLMQTWENNIDNPFNFPFRQRGRKERLRWARPKLTCPRRTFCPRWHSAPQPPIGSRSPTRRNWGGWRCCRRRQDWAKSACSSPRPDAWPRKPHQHPEWVGEGGGGGGGGGGGEGKEEKKKKIKNKNKFRKKGLFFGREGEKEKKERKASNGIIILVLVRVTQSLYAWRIIRNACVMLFDIFAGGLLCGATATTWWSSCIHSRWACKTAATW